MMQIGGGAYIAAKHTPIVAGVVVADMTVGGIDLQIAGAIVVGLFAGAVLRPSRYIGKPNSMRSMTRDFLGSAMALLANFIIAAVMVALGTLAIPEFPAVAAAGIGLFMGYKGPDGINHFNERFMGQKAETEPVMMTPTEPMPYDDMLKQLRELHAEKPKEQDDDRP